LAAAYAAVQEPRVSRIAAELRATLDRLEAACGAANDPVLSDGTGLIGAQATDYV
jgi:hypothetical protein